MTPDQLVHREIKYLINILNIMMATWLLRLVRAGRTTKMLHDIARLED